jgi:hypothetical protein
MKCPLCARELQDGARFCPACAISVDFGSAPTSPRTDSPPGPAERAANGVDYPGPVGFVSGRSPSKSSDFGFEGYYVPGTTLVDRYRIVSPLGKGGMGEVYRAQDLKVGQTVALKFLPKSLSHNTKALALFTREVRVARQVSHPNVCRVFDIGEADGQTFITMEFVDGEDIASLVRRIGHLPANKALQISRQVCAGLAAAHKCGIVHCDLKPANIMLDGRGHARITDFGLAGLAAEIQGEATHGGTPAYMSPEQFFGGEVTSKSDLYSLGLVMYEIFTGRHPYEASTFEEMKRMREKNTLAVPSTYLKEINPLVERVIMSCLERDPAKRPASALQVAASLPGEDPLAAALAAGETPSPEMVAEAGEEGILQPWKAWGLLGCVALLLVCCAMLGQHAYLINLVPGEKSPEVLSATAREIANGLGYTKRPADSAYWFDEQAESYLSLSQAPAYELYRGAVVDEYFPLVRLFYRESPRPIQTNYPWLVERDNPVATTVGDLTITLDTQGRLQSFRVIPYPSRNRNKPSDVTSDWRNLFQQAGLDFSQSKEAPSDWYTNQLMDQKIAWDVAQGGKTIHVHGGTYKERVVLFEVAGPWDFTDDLSYYTFVSRKVVAWIQNGLLGGLVLICVIVARKNMLSGRGDSAGALRGAIAIFLSSLVWLLLSSHRFSDAFWVFNWIQLVFGRSAVLALQWWVFYMAVEPYIRRTYPETLISWNRLIAGQLRNALVGRDVLLGVGFGAMTAIPSLLMYALPGWFPIKRPSVLFSPDILRETSVYLGMFALQATAALYVGLTLLASVFLAWKLFRNKAAALVAAGILWTVISWHPGSTWGESPPVVLGALLLMACLVRVGLLGLVVALYTYFSLLLGCLTTDFSRWYAPRSATTLLVVFTIAAYGFWTSTSGRKRLGTIFED